MSDDIGEIITLDEVKKIIVDNDPVISLDVITNGNYLTQIHDDDGLRLDCPLVPYEIQELLYQKALKEYEEVFYCRDLNHHYFSNDEVMGIMFWFNDKKNSTKGILYDDIKEEQVKKLA